MPTRASRMRLLAVTAAAMLSISGCARPVSSDGLAAQLDAVTARHPGALRDAPPEARALVDDLRQTWRAWGAR